MEALRGSRTEGQHVAHVMSTDLLSCTPTTPLAEAARRMYSARHSSILVRADENIVGIWTDQDALAQDLAGTDPATTPISRVMSSPVATVPSHASIADVTTQFKRQGVNHYVVLDEHERPCGFLSRRDLVMNHGVEWFMRLHSVRDAMNGVPAIAGPGMRASEAMRRMHAEGLDALIVRAPDGTTAALTNRDIIAYLGAKVADLPAYRLARSALPYIDVDESLFRARNLLVDRGVRHLGVTDATRQLVGLLGTREILATIDRGFVDDLELALEQRDDALRTSAERYRALVERSPDAIAVHRDQRILFINPAGARLLGAPAPGHVMGRSIADFLVDVANLPPEQRTEFLERETGSSPREERLLRLDDREIDVEMSSLPIPYGEHRAWQLVMRDISRRKELERELRVMATTDQLTGICNRAHFDEHLQQAIREVDRYDGNLCVLMFDLDRFKDINDELGHDGGDQVLKQVVQRVRAKLRDSDIFARWGGEEFMVLAPGIDRAGGERLADKLLAAIRTVEAGTNGPVTASFSVAIYRRGEKVQALLKRLDNTLYQAKRGGRDRAEFAD
ncbi:MAG: diguanylate cyclase [Halofilum sp. (in: g-proteobacteria)]|nr:diguanylate cyclase [Halofilum sp. (in: g-proteobacteria)]